MKYISFESLIQLTPAEPIVTIRTMPEPTLPTLSTTPPNSPPPPMEFPKPILRVKLSVLIILISILSPTFEGLVDFHTIYLPLYPISLILGAIGAFFVWYLLNPLNKLYLAAKLFARGELSHQIDIKSGDEIEAIALEFNQMAKNLSGSLGGVAADKDNLSTEKNKLNTIISSLSDGVVVLNMHKSVVLANQAAESLIGYSFKEMADKNIDELFILADKAKVPIPSQDFAPIYMGKEVHKFETKDSVVLTNKKGEQKTIRLISSPVLGNIQSDLGCILLLHDASPEKELESIQLDFVSMASHELRTPLTSVLGYLSVFLDENKDKLDPEQKESLERIMISAQQLNALIDNLLSVSKVERGAFSISATPMDYTKLLEKIVQDNQIQAVQKNISLKLELPPTELPKVSIDPVRISEVLNNLISNALNYTGSGGSITVKAAIQGLEIVTCVSDTGAGIPKDAQAHLFTKFFRVSGALDQSSNSKGTGLGLYISKSVIDLHKGKIWVESEVGKGSNFFFSLPLS